MTGTLNRRKFASSLAFGLGAAAVTGLAAEPVRNLKIGYSTLCWNVSPRDPTNFENALRDIANLGFWSFETVSAILDAYDGDGTLGKLIDKYQVPFKTGYVVVNATDPAARKESVQNVIRVGKIIRKHGGTYAVIQANSRRPAGARGPRKGSGGPRREPVPDTFNFQEHKADIVAALNECGMAVTDLGLGCGLHQHTGTVVETRDEVYATMEAVNTKYMKFAPDVGQLQKGGADAAKVVKDFASITDHMHLKDYSGGKYFLGYCPLGLGVVDLESILSTLEAAGLKPDAMVELDRPPDTPMSARDTAVFSKDYLMKLGYKFKS